MADPSGSADPVLDLRAGRPTGPRVQVWAQRHLQSFFFALGQLSRSPTSAILTSLVIAVALAFPAGLYTLLTNSLRVAQTWDSGSELSLFMKSTVSVREAELFSEALRARPEIAETRLITPDEGLNEFQITSGMARDDILVDGENPLPAVVVARVRDGVTQTHFSEILQALNNLKEVQYADFDMAWLARLRAIVAVFERALFVLAAVLAVGVLLIIGNTIRVDIDTRREEIAIAQLFGATNAFIRRPFLYGGLLIGATGSLLAWGIVSIGLLLLSGPVDRLTALYTSQFRLETLTLAEGAGLVATGLVLGVTGATLAVGRHLGATVTD